MVEMVPSAYYESLKRYWRRRKYQRMYAPSHRHAKRKLPTLRLGGGDDAGDDSPRRRRRLWRVRRVPKLQWKIIASPTKLLLKIREAYMGMMIFLSNKISNNSDGGLLFKSKKFANQREFSLMVSSGEQVDCRLVLEIYKKLAASQQLLSTASTSHDQYL